MSAADPDANASEWRLVDGIDPQTATFPVAVRFDDEPVWVFRGAQGFFGVQELCPHTNRTLDTALVVGDGAMIRCIHHHYTFKLSDGRGVNCPGFSIAVYDVMDDGQRLFIRPREASLAYRARGSA